MSPGAAGFDLFAPDDAIVFARSRNKLSLDIKLEMPKGVYAKIESRSGLALNYGITAFNGIIDSDYTGVLSVILFNHSEIDYKVNRGDRIAQLIFCKAYHMNFKECKIIQATERGDKGFGSTGK